MFKMKRLKLLVVPINALVLVSVLMVSGCVSNKRDLAEARKNYEKLERANRNNF